MPMSKMVVANGIVFFPIRQETLFQAVKYFNYAFHSLDLQSRKLYWKTTERRYRIT